MILKYFVKSVFSKFGYEIRRVAKERINSDENLRRFLKIVHNNTMLPADRLAALYEQVKFCEFHRIPGCFIECGVWKGGAVGLMALANLKYGECRRDIHLFDSFEEICEPDESVDGEKALKETAKWRRGKAEGKLIPLKGIYDVYGGASDFSHTRNFLENTIGYSPSRLYYHKGWFQETLPEDANAIGNIALLRIDGDWYASTKICLEYLYEKVVPGGFVTIDDYGTYEGCRKATDDFIAQRGLKAYLNFIDSSCVYWIKHPE